MTTIVRSAVGSLAAIGFLKFLSENKFKIIGTDITSLSIGKFYVDNFYEVPKADQVEAVIKKYLTICENENAKWIISGPETEVLVLIREKTQFENIGVHILHPDYATLEIITDKLNLYKFFKKKGINMPFSCDLQKDETTSLKGKVVLKPKQGRGSTGIYFTGAQQLGIYKKIIPVENYIAQEFIEGEEYTVDVLYDLEGNILNIVPRKRLKIDSGVSVIGETVKDEKLLELIVELSSHLKFVGGNCFKFIKSTSKEYFLTDINPRFGGGSILALKASESFRKNLCNLLNGNYESFIKLSLDFEIIRMYRSYEEVFKN